MARQGRDLARREFHISRAARDRYRLEGSLFQLTGNVVLADFHAARLLAQRINDRRDVVRFPEQAVSAGELNAMGLIDEVLHVVVARYREQVRSTVMAEALGELERHLGAESVDEVLRTFTDEFPPVAVYRRELTVEEYLSGSSGGVSHREVALEELLLLWLANRNPAFQRFAELFDDDRLQRRTSYPRLLDRLAGFLRALPPAGPGGESLIDLLEAPMRAAPHSLEGQLEFIHRSWPSLLGPLIWRVLPSLDLLAEERKPFFGFGPGPVEVPSYEVLEAEPEAYSPDRDWMPRLVLLAKNAFVWLHQLSALHQRPIERLDQVPDAELDRIAGWGVTGLWLIGVWQRSRASKRIKELMGDRDAAASAYSIDDYRVADDLGGEPAFDELKRRAWQRGIRLSTDMVPNHVGIDSRWVVQHPHWFISLDYSPFPSYTFSGPDLSDDVRVGIFLEDHYYSRSDAAVVFQRVDRLTGSVRYLYHGNDGTSMPWNDTAQLDYRLPEVREAVIQTILHVARRSPVIRFDAAMTLTKRHYHRLWFPEPGAGGDIPSRAGLGMSRAELDAVMPVEFWREVVDRVAAEAPDTLLLAEAFWLLEGYFVRSLGMHRVYNSAFMNMLRDERNAEYRQLIKNTLEFDPQILKRYVSFMSNPDERTAIDQFGRDDKYFGVLTMLATLPGLPMLGHGQVEGLTEKYGMEFRRPMLNETPDRGLVERHERQIFPLLRQRHLFAEVDRFLLYDLVTPSGDVDENVFAYSNAAGDQRALIVYNNRYGDTRGWLRASTAVAVKEGEGGTRLVRRSLAEGLGLPERGDAFLCYRDHTTGLHHVHPCAELAGDGLRVELGAYGLKVLLDLRVELDDASRRLAQLAHYLGGRGVPSLKDAYTEILLAPVLEPYRALVGGAMQRRLLEARVTAVGAAPDPQLLEEVGAATERLLAAAREELGGSGDIEEVAQAIARTLEAALRLPAPLAEPAPVALPAAGALVDRARQSLGDEPAPWCQLFAWVFSCDLGRLSGADDPEERSRSLMDDWRLAAVVDSRLREQGLDEGAARRATGLVKLLVGWSGWHRPPGGEPLAPGPFLERVLRDAEARRFLDVNRHRGALWFNQECFAELLDWLAALAVVEIVRDRPDDPWPELDAAAAVVERLEAAAEVSGYRVDRLLEAVSEPPTEVEPEVDATPD